MIKAKDAIAAARSLIGTPYKELDCINLIKKVIRTAAGGAANYTTAGTNTLWNSLEAAAKYRDLTWRQESISGARAGMIAFKRNGSDAHHAGIVTEAGTVVHSSSTQGGRGVVETPLTADEGWNALGIHRYIEAADGAAESGGETVAEYKMRVKLLDPTSSVNVRKGPSLRNDVIGRLGDGAVVTVKAESDGWAFVSYGDSGMGYISAEYLAEPETDAQEQEAPVITIIDSEGNTFRPVGDWRVLTGSVD